MGIKKIGRNAQAIIDGLDISFEHFQSDMEHIEYAKPNPATRGESILAPALRALDQLAEYELAETLCPAAIRLTLAAFIRLPKQYPIQDQFKNPLCIMLDVVLGG